MTQTASSDTLHEALAAEPRPSRAQFALALDAVRREHARHDILCRWIDSDWLNGDSDTLRRRQNAVPVFN